MKQPLEKGKKIYFVSDCHFGIPDHAGSLAREKLLVKWLEEVSTDAQEIFLMGDIFDFWFEYRSVVPKGYVRLLGKLAELTDKGLPIHYFTGNHDMWVFDYFEKEMGLIMHRKPVERVYNDQAFFIGHGDGLGPGDRGYKIMKSIFSCRVCQKLFSFIHPGFGTGMALYFSKKSRLSKAGSDEVFLGEEKERLITFCKNKLKEKHFDYFIFGHRHLPLDIEVAPGSRYINAGDWITYYSYVVFDGEKLELKNYR